MKFLKLFFFFCVFVAAIGAGLFAFFKVKMLQAYSPGEPAWQTTMRAAVDPRSVFPGRNDLYVLVLGTDHNYTNKDIMYTTHTDSDTMILFHLDLNDKSVKLLSIPRDTRVYIPGDCYHGSCYDKINAAIEEGGPRLAERVVTNLTGIPIDYFAHIKLEGLKNLVAAIGGVDVYVDEDMNYDDNWGHLHVHLKKGFQHLDADKAEQFARFRHDAMGDYARIERQHRLIKAIAKKLEDPMMLVHLDEIVKVARKNVDTDFTLPQLLALADLYKGGSLSAMKDFTYPTVPKDINEFGTWVSYVIPVDDQAKQVIGNFTADEPSAQVVSGVTVEVLNGSGMAGAAQDVAQKLRAGGFQVSRVGNADNFNYDKTVIQDHSGKGDGIAVAKLLGSDESAASSVPQNPPLVDVTVIVGKDHQVSENVEQQ